MGVHDQLDDLLVESPTIPDDLEIFKTFSPGDNNSEYNEYCWAASLDFTGRSWKSYDANGNPINSATNSNGTAISPRHVVVAFHSKWYEQGGLPWPWKLTFIAADGTRHQRTILGKSQVVGSDIQLLYLDEPDLPSTIANYKILPVDYENYLPYMYEGLLRLGLGPDYEVVPRNPAIGSCQHRRAHVCEIYSVEEWATDKWRIAVTSFLGQNSIPGWHMSGNRDAYSTYEYGIMPGGGDSGHPTFMLLGGEMVLLGCWATTLHCVFVSRYIDAINAAMLQLEADNGGRDGYQLQTIALGPPPRVVRRQIHAAGSLRSEIHAAGSLQSQTHAAGALQSQIHAAGPLQSQVHAAGSLRSQIA